MQIIISGCDRSGKTSMSNKIIEDMNAEYFHFDSPKSLEAGKAEYFNFIDGLNPNKNYLCDRFYMEEDIYAPIYRGYNLNYAREIEKHILNKNNALYVYVKADIDTIRNRIKRCGEDFVKDEDLEKVINNYNKFLFNCKLPFITITNNDTDDRDKNAEECVKYAKLANEILTTHRVNNSIPFGNMKAKYFFVIKEFNSDTLKHCFGDYVLNLDCYTDSWFTTYDCFERELDMLKPDNVFFVKRD
jgi:thymidylate kinase